MLWEIHWNSIWNHNRIQWIFCQQYNSYTKPNLKKKNENRVKINSNTTFLFPFISEELFRLIDNKLKPKYSTGYDISAAVVKSCLKGIEPLTFLLNLSFHIGSFSGKWRMNKMKDMRNYRPIALMPVFSKFFEYCFLEQLLKFLDKHSILNDNQFGFRSKRITNDAIYALLKCIVEHKNLAIALLEFFCDLSKAYLT